MFASQVVKLFYRRNHVNKLVCLKYSSDAFAKVLVPLDNRKLLRVSGPDTQEFLQGLITNDMRHFLEGSKSVYSMFLNQKGRVLFDTLIHKWAGPETFLIECDRNIQSQLIDHLNRYKLKRDIKLQNASMDYKLWSLISPVTFVPELSLDVTGPINIYKDPRLLELGYRVISRQKLEATDVIKLLGQDVLEGEPDVYKYVRYKLGIAEGTDELPPGECIPLEANCDFLHGVSFQKGCYIGQELTARIHHTGVIRKRIMPLKFSDVITDVIEKDTLIRAQGNTKSNLGKLKGFVHDYGLGLVRIKEVMETKELDIAGKRAEPIKPNWWPIETPKETPQIQRTD